MTGRAAEAPTAPATVVVDLSCSGLVVATCSASQVLHPAVAPVSVVPRDRAGRLDPPGPAGRIVCSDATDELGRTRPDLCLLDPVARCHLDRVDVAGLSVPTVEALAAPVDRALRWAGAEGGAGSGRRAGAGAGDDVLALVPSRWAGVRIRRLAAALAGLGGTTRAVRAALVWPEALESSSARWTVAVEICRDLVTLALVERTPDGPRLVRRSVVHRRDPRVDLETADLPSRVVAAVAEMRSAHRAEGASSGSTEVLVRGDVAESVVDAFDAARVLSFVVPEAAPAEAALRVLGPVGVSARR